MKTKRKAYLLTTMEPDSKRELLRHLVATVAFRTKVAVTSAPAGFAELKITESIRTPAEILAHMGDCLQGSLSLMKGDFVYLNSQPLPWHEEIARFFSAAKEFDSYLATDAKLEQPIEKIMQGPIADSLTHAGQLVMLRRVAGAPVQINSYFAAEIIPGQIYSELPAASTKD